MTTTLEPSAQPPWPPGATPPTPPAPPRQPRQLRVPRIPPIPRKQITHTHRSIFGNWVIASLGVLFVWIIAFAFGLSSFKHAHAQAVLYSKFRQQLATDTAPLGARTCLPIDNPDGTSSTKCVDTQLGAPVAVMDAPAAGLHHEVIVEGTSSTQLADGPGHYRTTPMPGQLGTVYVYGRSRLFGGPFHDIAAFRRGDVITFTTGQGESKYVVDDVRRAGDPIPNQADGHGHLWLATSDASGWRSGWAPARVLYVDATLQGTPFIDPGGRLSVVPPSEEAMRGDTNALYQLVLWLPVLAMGGAVVVWAHHRWGGWQTWVVGAPVILAGLWGVTETAALFLPNLL